MAVQDHILAVQDHILAAKDLYQLDHTQYLVATFLIRIEEI